MKAKSPEEEEPIKAKTPQEEEMKPKAPEEEEPVQAKCNCGGSCGSCSGGEKQEPTTSSIQAKPMPKQVLPTMKFHRVNAARSIPPLFKLKT
ncbi:MAG: hypothetical protein HC845_13540 [Akkermansiaceae bacterium]|nr:hypothetical protein [Akkermansiaceae bacterium]